MEKDNERESGQAIIAQTILLMKYDELVALASELVRMQKDAKDDGWEWDTTEVYGEFGLAHMLHSWAEGYNGD